METVGLLHPPSGRKAEWSGAGKLVGVLEEGESILGSFWNQKGQ